MERIHDQLFEANDEIGISPLFGIEKAAWVAHGKAMVNKTGFWTFKLDFEVTKAERLTFELSADQRFELYVDRHRIGMGPDRSDQAHWSFHTYQGLIEAGKHTIEVFVSYIEQSKMPVAQTSVRPGFIFHCRELSLNTGEADWQVIEHHKYQLHKPKLLSYHVVGPSFEVNPLDQPTHWQPTVIVKSPTHLNGTGILNEAPYLQPTRLPEMLFQQFPNGRVLNVDNLDFDKPITKSEINFDTYQNFLDGHDSLIIPSNIKLRILVDLENYYCFFPKLTWDKGLGAKVEISWAESTFRNMIENGSPNNHYKDNRNEFLGKYWRGFGDTYHGTGSLESEQIPWWRSGTQMVIYVKTKEEAIELINLELNETRYPLETASFFETDKFDFKSIEKIGVRGLKMCSHETYMDCPYYEQMMYVGDTRIQMLVWYLLSTDTKLPKRGIEIYDWSRNIRGWIMERYPSTPLQLSCTFSMIWIYMVHDYMMYRNDPDFIRQCIPGIRSLLEKFKRNMQKSMYGIVENLPGWSFIDWTEEFDCGVPPVAKDGLSSIQNLQLILSFEKAAAIEQFLGETEYAQNYLKHAHKLASKVRQHFYCSKRTLIACGTDLEGFSEHAQALAILADSFDNHFKETLKNGFLEQAPEMKCTVYYSHYLFEAFNKLNLQEQIVKDMDLWHWMVSIGVHTTIETPEPSRSDCHAWGAHPIFHMHSSLMGIRPISAGFQSFEIKPRFDLLKNTKGRVVHEKGDICYELKDNYAILITTPIPGILKLPHKKVQLEVGYNEVLL